VNVENDLWVMSPLAIPLPGNPTAATINRTVLRTTIRALRLRLGIGKFQLWTFLPNTAPYVGTLGEEAAIYYCVDEWSMFSYLNREQTVAAERALLGKVDAVFAINNALADAKRKVNPRTFVSPHGVDHAMFSRALAANTVEPADIASLPHPRLGFYGTLQDWVDFELIAHVARARPAWQIVLIGQQLADLSALDGLPNVHLLGQKRHDELPAYCKAFDVGLIPYRIDERMTFVNPLKLREYLSAGLPVVSTPVPEVARFSNLARVASTKEEFVAAAQVGLPCVILRPGQIFGGGIPLINGAVARKAAGRWLVLGDGKLELPLVYIDDVVQAILAAIDRRITNGEIIQIIDPEPMTQEAVLAAAGGATPILRVPRGLVFALGTLTEIPLAAIGKQSPIGSYRLKSALARLHYESDRAVKLLGWRPQVGVREGIKRVSR
jgi:glycosyltransferase involved in cell wall biosynthesis